MKKRLISLVIAVVMIAGMVPLVPASAATGVLDRVVISPTSANISIGATQLFAAQGEDSNNATAPDLTYSWSVVAGGGTISDTGVFTAGNVTGTFPDTIKIIATQGSTNITRTALATVIVSEAVPVPGQPKTPPGWSHGNKKGWGGDTQPPGWANGNKKGWSNGMPPGLAGNKGRKK